MKLPYGRALALLVLVLSGQSAAAQRLITLGGEVTETAFALGVGEQVVAVDSSSSWPPAANALPRVGYVRTLAAEGILAMAPDLVLASAHAGPPEVLEKLAAAGVEVMILPGPPPVESTLQLIQQMAARLNREPQGAELVAGIRQQLAALPERPLPINALAVIGGQGGQLMAAGRGTRADAMLQLAGATNVSAAFSGYRPLSDESLLMLSPDVIVVPDHALPMLGGREELLRRPGVAATPAGKARHVVVMDGLLLLGMGPRLGQAGRELHEAMVWKAP